MTSPFRQPTPPPLVPFKYQAPLRATSTIYKAPTPVINTRGEAPQLDSTDSVRLSVVNAKRRADATTQIVPIQEQPEGDRATSLQVALPSVPPHRQVQHRMRVLVCDDDMLRCGAFQQGLHGALVVVSGSAATSRHLITLERWDVIFLDLCDGADGTALQVAKAAADHPTQVASTLFIVHSLDPCGAQAARLLRSSGVRVQVRAFAWLEIPLLRRLVRERRWPRQERLTADGFNPPLVLQLPS
jgi:hypothetical protein